MTTTARNLLATFDGLDPTEKQEVAVEILRRSAGMDDLPDKTFEELTAELFQGYRDAFCVVQPCADSSVIAGYTSDGGRGNG